MPTIRIDRTRVQPHYPKDALKIRSFYQWTKENSIYPELLDVNIDYEWWRNIPGPNADRRLRINGANFNEAFNYLSNIDLQRWIESSINQKSALKHILLAINIYSILKISHLETSMRTKSGELISYITDYITINPNDGFSDRWDGRCILNIDPHTLHALIYELEKCNWPAFWTRICLLYESVFVNRNPEIENPKHSIYITPKTKLGIKYHQRDKQESISKEYIVNLLEKSFFTNETFNQIMDIIKKDPKLALQKKTSL